jgi:hypothetical protein
MENVLLFYRKLVANLCNMGYKINPYNPCVVNKTVNGTQMTVRWHVDDLMIRHTNQDDIMAFVKKIKDIHGENLAEKVGTIHNYLGMMFDYSFNNKVRINMSQYISNVIKEFPQEISRMCTTPAADHLFKIQENGN